MATERLIATSEPVAPEAIQAFLYNQSVQVENLHRLHGGYTSQVYGALLNGQPIVIKQSLARESFYPVHQRLEESRAWTEVEILERLEPLFPGQVPKILGFYPEESLILMSDVGINAQLGLSYFLSGRAGREHARDLGSFLARLKQETAGWEPFETVEQPFEQIWIRGLETEVASPEWGRQLRDYYLKSKPQFVWVDGHPKNIFLSDAVPAIRAIDFDCSHFADPDYMLPNFLGQLPVFAAMGHITPQQGVDFAQEMIAAYAALEPIPAATERKMVFYAGTQTVQRQDGKWLFDVCGQYDDEALKRKAFLFYFGRKVLSSVTTFDDYLKELGHTLREWSP